MNFKKAVDRYITMKTIGAAFVLGSVGAVGANAMFPDLQKEVQVYNRLNETAVVDRRHERVGPNSTITERMYEDIGSDGTLDKVRTTVCTNGILKECRYDELVLTRHPASRYTVERSFGQYREIFKGSEEGKKLQETFESLIAQYGKK